LRCEPTANKLSGSRQCPIYLAKSPYAALANA